MDKGTAVSVPPKRIPDPYEGEYNADERIVADVIQACG
jgi:hypothetical protein